MGFLNDLKKGTGEFAGGLTKVAGLLVAAPVKIGGILAGKLGGEDIEETLSNAADSIFEFAEEASEDVEEIVTENIGTVMTTIVGGLLLDEARKQRDENKKIS